MKKLTLLGMVLVVAFLGISATSSQAVTLWATGDNDGYIHRSTYPPSWGGDHFGGWTTDTTTLSVYSAYYNPGWERDYASVEIPIASLRTGTVTAATLQLYSLGFGNYWYYGSTNVYHLNPGGYSPTGNLAVDNPNSWGSDWGWTLFSTDIPIPGSPGWKAFDVTDAVLSDLSVSGRNFSTFWIEASRETYGSLSASEQTGFGPNMNVQGDNLVPIPGSVLLLGTGLLSLAVVGWRKKRS